MTQHTPGPWTLSGLDIEANGKRIASTSWRKMRPASMTVEGNEGVANARLIAAAPEMLAILQELRRAAVLGEPAGDIIEKACALLARIEGENNG